LLDKMVEIVEIKKILIDFYPRSTYLVNKEIHEFLCMCKTFDGDLKKRLISFLSSNLRVDIPEGDFKQQIQILHDIKTKLKKGNGSSRNKEIPGFITENILKMPSNRGYIWKDTKYFGKIPNTNKPIVLFEPRKGKTFIHVFDVSETRIFEKLKGQQEQCLLKIIKHVTSQPTPVNNVVEINSPETVPIKSSNKFAALDSDSEV